MLALSSLPKSDAKPTVLYYVTRSDEAPFEQATALGAPHRKPPQSEGIILNEGVKAPATDIAIEEIYRAPDFGTIELASALSLLREAIVLCNRALEALAKNAPLHADTAMIKVQTMMSELFCCRAVGDGLAEVVNAVQSSFENLGGTAMSQQQIEVVRNAFIAVRSEPRMSFDRSLEMVSAMELAGLEVDPAPTDALAEWLDD
jgi:hypothetical protein